MLPDSQRGAVAWARASLPPSGFTPTMPGISFCNSLMMAGPLALSSIKTAFYLRELPVARFDGGHGGREVEAVIDAVRQHVILPCRARPDLAGHKVIVRAAGEGAVPGLDHEVKLGRQLAVELDPLALDDAAFERRGRLLVLTIEGPAAHAEALAVEERSWEPSGPEERVLEAGFIELAVRSKDFLVFFGN